MKKYGADETGKTFGPGHDGWYAVLYQKPELGIVYKKAKSAFAAAAAAGLSLTECSCHPITDQQHKAYTAT